jgi:HEXXH motif-containing protein
MRLGRAGRELGRPPLSRAVPGARACLSELRRALASLPPAERDRYLRGPDIRGFLGEADIWIEALHLAASAAGRGPGGAAARVRLFDRVSRTEHLVRLAPRGRIDAGFAARVARFGRPRLRQAVADLAAFVVGLRLACPLDRPLDLDLEFREEPEQGRPRDRIDLGAVMTPAGPLGIVAVAVARSRRRPAPSSVLRRIRARLAGRTLILRGAGSDAVIPAAGSRLRGESAASSTPFALVARDTIPGTSILIGPAVDSRPRRLAVGRPVAGLGGRLARALRIVRLAWPEGHREILRRTRMVVPIREAGLVSYSLAARPGVSFINVFGKATLDLADDLLHETAHHRLHDLQEIEEFLAHDPDAEEVQAFDSPWRGTKRPLHGILHGAYTFMFRAELLRRVMQLSRERPRLLTADLARRRSAWMRRELRRELAMLGKALRELQTAARAGLLTPAGCRLVGSIRHRLARLRRP